LIKLLVAGPRNYNNFEIVLREIRKIKPDIIITSKKCGGVDNIGRFYSYRYKSGLNTFKANWDKFGNSAGYLRNEKMVLECTESLIFWDNISTGTKLTIDLLKQYNKPYKLIEIN